MARQKKIKVVQEESKQEVNMTEEVQLESLHTEIDVARLELAKTKQEIEESKKKLENNRREISPEERRLAEKQISVANTMKASENVIEKQKSYDSEKVTGKFMNRRAPGQPVKLPYIKYADDPVKWYPFEDGKVYTIPRGFADQINEHYHTPHFIQKEGPQAADGTSSIHSVDTSNKKYAFVPVNF